MSDHINVSVRLRPPLEKEIREKLKINWTVENGTIYLLENEKKTQEGCTFGNHHSFYRFVVFFKILYLLKYAKHSLITDNDLLLTSN